MTRGIVIGKFYPPHRGHKYLIETAAGQVDALTVIVCDLPTQRIRAEQRAAWLREIHPGVHVMVVADIGYDDDSQRWADYTRSFLGYAPDAVFTSEGYGDAYARYLGCQHVLVDQARMHVPVSGTQVRTDPLAYWDLLEPCVRAHYALRVCVVGAESTGTTTLARALAEHFDTTWVPEFGRTYSEAKASSRYAADWSTEDFVYIAQTQNAMEDHLARTCNRLLVCDTDSFATSMWHERYVGHISPAVDKLSAGRSPSHYLLTDVDIPFVQDGLRDGEHIRVAMHGRFRDELTRRGLPHSEFSGPRELRLAKAVTLSKALLDTRHPKADCA